MITHSQLGRFALTFVREVAIVGAAASFVVLCTRVIGYIHFSTGAPPEPHFQMRGPQVTVGSQIKLEWANFERHPLSLLLVSSPDCHYCLASKSFHAKLNIEAQRHGVPFYVVVPERTSAKIYLKSVGISESATKDWKDLSFRTGGTPTLIGVDSTATVGHIWVGRLSSERETEVLNAIQTSSLLPLSGSIRPPESQHATYSFAVGCGYAVSVAVFEQDNDGVEFLDGGLKFPYGIGGEFLRLGQFVHIVE